MDKKIRSGKELATSLFSIRKKAEKDFSIILSKLSIDAFRELITRSAADTGYLRSNWEVTTGKASSGVLNARVKGSNYSDSSYPNLRIKLGDTINLYNNTEYAIYLENGTPYMQAQPMIEPTYAKINAEAKTLCKTLSRMRIK